MKIKFDLEDRCYCTTPCPYGFIDGYTGEPKKVGSISCADCFHFVSTDIVNNVIECNYDEHQGRD